MSNTSLRSLICFEIFGRPFLRELRGLGGLVEVTGGDLSAIGGNFNAGQSNSGLGQAKKIGHL
jgi:hypothetical protein